MRRWYDDDGEIIFIGIKEARKEKYKVSITSVISDILSKPELDQWKKDQVFFAMLHHERDVKCLVINHSDAYSYISEYEDIDQYKKRIMIIANEKSTIAKDFGSTIHKLIERYLRGERVDIDQYDEKVKQAFTNLKLWCDENIKRVLEIEKVFVGIEFAGKIDLLCQLQDDSICLIDFKTQQTDNGFNFYHEWLYQLGGYSLILWENSIKIDKYMSVIISSITGEVKANNKGSGYSDEDMEKGRKAFQALFSFWKLHKSYNILELE